MAAHPARLAAVPEVPTSVETASHHELNAATIACHIVARRDELLLDNPVVAAAAEGYLAFATCANGKTAAIMRFRSPEYAKAQRSAKKGISYEDLVGMAVAGDVDSKRALLALLAPILDRLEGDSAGSGMELGEAVADFVKETNDVGDAFMRGKTTTAIYRELTEAQESMKRLTNAIRARRSMTSELARVLEEGGVA